jgi:Pyridoxamine 5'-phosphate oxidase
MSLGCLVQRQGPGDPLPQFTGRGERGERLHAGAVRLDQDAGDPDAPGARGAQRLDVGGARHADQQAAVAQRRQRGHADRAADQIQDHVDVGDLLSDVHPGVVDRLIDSELGEKRLVTGSSSADHVAARVLGDLRGQAADPARRRLDQDPVAGLWPEVAARLAAARSYWLCTTIPSGAPHAAPVWGVVISHVLDLCSERRTVKARNLAVDPRVVVHLESAGDVVIVRGTVEDLGTPAQVPEVVAGLSVKYADEEDRQYLPDADPDFDVVYAIRPQSAMMWHCRRSLRSQHEYRRGPQVPALLSTCIRAY